MTKFDKLYLSAINEGALDDYELMALRHLQKTTREYLKVVENPESNEESRAKALTYLKNALYSV